MKPKHLQIKNHELYLNNYSLKEIAKTYGTPLYVFDEIELHEKMQEFTNNFISKKFQTNVVYASKAFLVPAIVEIVKNEGLYMDSVSIGDLYVAKMAGLPLKQVVFHGNNKENEELVFAVKNDVGLIVVDNIDELKRLKKIAEQENKQVNTLFRVNPGIDAHTHKYTKTALYESKFGESIYDEQTIDEIIKTYQNDKYVKLLGFHSHIGSQIKETKPFILNIEKMINFSRQIELKYNIQLPVLNIGGGFGIKYHEKDSDLFLPKLLKKMIKHIEKVSQDIGYNIEKVMIEPGRSIVGTAGITLYECGIVKHTYGKKNYLFINGGMTDNIRPALYQAKYEVDIVNKIEEKKEIIVDIAGKCCESGDIIAYDAPIPYPEKGDILVVYATGAYTHSMSSNYNNILKPAVIFVGNDIKCVATREKLEDLYKQFK